MLPTDTSTSTGAASLVSYDREADRAAVRIQRRRDTLEAFAAVIVTIVIALAICFVMLLAVGKDPVEAYHWLLTGPFSRTTRLGQVIVLTTTLTILGLSVAIPFRSGLLSLGAEGQLYMGALAATAVSLGFPLAPGFGIIVPMIAAMTAGAIVGLIPGWMKAYLGANELVSSLMLNTVLIQLYGYILTRHLTPEGATSVASAYLPDESVIPSLTSVTGIAFGQANLALILVPLLTVAVWAIIQRTPFGYEVRTLGSNSLFAAYGGIKSKRVIILGFLISGAIAGLAGAHLVEQVIRQLCTHRLGERAENLPVLARLAGWEHGEASQLHPAFGVDVGGVLLGVGGTRQDHVGARRPGVAVVALVDDEGVAEAGHVDLVGAEQVEGLDVALGSPL